MEFKSNVIVLYSRPFEIEDEKTKKLNRGVSIQYLMDEKLLPKETDQDKGLKVNKGSIDFLKQGNLIQVPGLYEASFTMKTNGNGKPELAIADLDFKGILMLEIDESLAEPR